jgi:hypothetical protein
VQNTASALTLKSGSNVVTIGTNAGASKLKLYDAGAGVWKNLHINNGTVTVEAG